MGKALDGEEVVITKAGNLPPATAPKQREIESAKGDFEAPKSFDDPLPDHVLDEFEA